MTPREGMEHAAELFGSDWKLAEAIGFSQYAFWRARTLGRPSAEMANNIEHVTGGKVTRLMLRPDIFAIKPQLIPNAWKGSGKSKGRKPKPS